LASAHVAWAQTTRANGSHLVAIWTFTCAHARTAAHGGSRDGME